MAVEAPAPDRRLLELLLLLLDAGRPLSRDEIFDAIPAYRTAKPAAGERKFERDKKDLREIGLPLVEGNDEGPGYSIDRELYELPAVEIDDEERAALVLAAEAVRSASGLAYRDLVEDALTKLTFERGPGAGGARPAHLAVDLAPRRSTAGMRKRIEQLTAAAEARKRVAIRYEQRDGKSSERSVDPYALIYRAGDWLLLAHCHLRNAPRTFRVDRIRNTRVAGRPGSPDFDRPDDVTLGRLLARSPWAFAAGASAVVDVVLDIGPERGWIADEDFGEGTRREPLADGWTRVHFRSGNPDYILIRVLDGAGHVRLVAPAALRARLTAIAREMSARHARQGTRVKA